MSISSGSAGQSSKVEISPKDDDFSLNNCVKHVIRKAHYKPLGNGQLVKRGWFNFIRRNLEGNTADDRYHRAAYESSQRNTAAMLAETYRATVTGATGADANLANNTLLQKRFTRQDNLRFNPELQHEENYGLNKRNRWGVMFSRWAHHLNGVTELGAAPTGMLLKSSRIALTPDRDDRSGWGQVRIIAALGLIAGAVSALSIGLFGQTIGRVSKHVGAAVAADVRATVAGYGAVAAVSAICSLVFAGVSGACLSRSQLSPVVMRLLENNREKHINRLYTLLSAFKDTPDAVSLLTKALQPKIGKAYRAEGPEGQPVLLTRLLHDVQAAEGHAEQAKQAIRATLGAYLVEKDPTGERTGDLLSNKTDSRELLRRENHVIVLTNLIEHNRIYSDPGPEYKDLRHQFEGGIKTCREKVLGGTANLLNVLGFRDQSRKVAHMNTKEFMNARENRKKAPAHAHEVRYHLDHMLDNRHQYGWLTRKLLIASESIRTFNHNVPLSLNYQVTRPIAWLTGRITEHGFNRPNSRTVSFSVGRALASSMWAVVDVLLIGSPAAGRGLGFGGRVAADGIKTLPWNIPLGQGRKLPIGATSTAAQMFLISGLSFGFAVLASKVARMEGWKGNVARSIEAPDSKRAPLNIGNLTPR
jgi:hypothetical protein